MWSKHRFNDGMRLLVALLALVASCPALEAQWLGADGVDRAGGGGGVGPDGCQDVALALADLDPVHEILTVTIVAIAGDGRWIAGPNPGGEDAADLQRDASDPTAAVMRFQPRADLIGATLSVEIAYRDAAPASAELVAGACDPQALAEVADLVPALVPGPAVTWLGQDGSGRPGDVRLRIADLPAARKPVACVIADGVVGSWGTALRASVHLGDGDAVRPARWVPAADGSVDVYLAPVRDESDATLYVRLIYADGSMSITEVAGGACDPDLGAPARVEDEVELLPGDDVQAAVADGGTVRLGAGDYALDRPLIISTPVALIGDGAVLRFTQPDGDAPWSEAIAIDAGSVSLTGFALRFAAPVRWDHATSYGPALIGFASPWDANRALRLERLDLEAPPSGAAPG
ncbi:MAG: hypothetical protein H0X45_16125, partial [Planctomycetes bacterium]|nr:hypothetical protein [Planctomycetota bacterium]